MPQLQPYRMIIDCGNQNGRELRAVRAQNVRVDLVAREGARRRVERETRETCANAALERLFRVCDAVQAVLFAELHHARLAAVRHHAEADLRRLHPPQPRRHRLRREYMRHDDRVESIFLDIFAERVRVHLVCEIHGRFALGRGDVPPYAIAPSKQLRGTQRQLDIGIAYIFGDLFRGKGQRVLDRAGDAPCVKLLLDRPRCRVMPFPCVAGQQ